MEKRQIKHGLHETMPPMKPEDEAKIKGRDVRLSEELALGAVTENKAIENIDLAKLMSQARRKIEGLKEEINGLNKLMDEKVMTNQKVVSKFESLKLKMDEIDRELYQLGVGPAAEKAKRYGAIIDSMDKYVRELEEAKHELRSQIKNLEELN